MATPIFVVGKHRSGTTWLANLLCEHPRVAGVKHVHHHGLHESSFFSCIYDRFGDLSVATNYVEFVEVVSAGDYFRLAGADREFLYSLWPISYGEVFRVVMDRLAEGEGATHWLEKSPAHSLQVDRIAALYPDARFIAVRRNATDVAASTVALTLRRAPGLGKDLRWRRREVLTTALSWVYYNRVLESFASRCNRIFWVRYEALETDLPGSLAEICGFLGLPFEAVSAGSRYRPNTGFVRGNSRASALSAGEQRLVAAVERGAGALPLALLHAAAAWSHRNRRQPLPKWFFSMLDVPWTRADLLPITITGDVAGAGIGEPHG